MDTAQQGRQQQHQKLIGSHDGLQLQILFVQALSLERERRESRMVAKDYNGFDVMDL